MQDRTLITTGSIGAMLACLCCFTPPLGVVGLTVWPAKANYARLPVLLLCLALLGLGLYRKRLAAEMTHGGL
jgi:mercuric ion transport protein